MSRFRKPRLGGLWRHRDFRLYWGASTVSAFGTAVTRLALPLIATLTLKASPFEIGLIAFAEEAPLLVLGLPVEVWVDRHRRLPVMLVCDLARAVTLLAVPIAWWLDRLSVPILVLAALAVGALSVFFDIASQAMVSTLLEPKDFVEGNGKRYAAESAANAGGPAVGGALVQLVGAAPSVLIDVVSYLASFLFLRRMTFVETAPARRLTEPVLASIRAGLREITRSPLLRAVTGMTSTITFLYGMGAVMFVPFASRTLGLSSAVIGAALTVSGIGSVVGAMVAGRLAKRFGVGRGLEVSLIATVPGLVLAALATGGPWIAAGMLIVGLFAAGLASPLYDIPQFSLRQAVTVDAMRGRVSATSRVAIRGAAALGALAGGAVAGVIGLRATVAIAAVSPLVTWVILRRSPVYAVREMPIAPPVEASAFTPG